MKNLRSKLKAFSAVMLGATLLSLAVLPSGDATGAANCPIVSRVRGSTTVGPISDGAKPFVQAAWTQTTMDNSNPWGGSGAGITAIRNGTAELGQSSRALTAAEANGIYVYRVARDGMLMAVQNSPAMNFINNITTLQVRQIYQSGYTGASWDDYGLGGPANQIVMRSRITTSGTYPDFISLFAINAGLEATTISNSGLGRLQESEDMANAAAGAPYVIAYTSLANIDVPNVKILSVDGVAGNQTTVGSLTYPKLRVLHYMVRENASTPTGTLRIDNSNTVRADDIVNFLFSAAGQSLVDDTGFVPVGAAPSNPIPDGDVNMNGSHDGLDLGAITSAWGASSACTGWVRADANNSGNVSLGDIGVVTGSWGNAGFIKPTYP